MKKVLAVVLVVLFLHISNILPAIAFAQEEQMEVEGWHLIESFYLVPDEDLDINGGPIESRMSGVANGLLLDYLQDTWTQGDVILKQYRTDKGGTVFASIEWEVLWENPPTYLPGDQPVSITVEHRVLEAMTWNPPSVGAAFDVPDLEIGFCSATPNTLHKPGTRQNPYRDETTEAYSERAVMTTERKVASGGEDDRIALYISFGKGYGMRYTYRWGVSAVETSSGQQNVGDDKPVQNGDTKNGDTTVNDPPTTGSGSPFGATDSVQVLWTNNNPYGVENNAIDYYVIFDLPNCHVTEIMTYHYGSKGKEPGTIILYSEDGSKYGPFKTIGREGQGGVVNAYWIATVDLQLPAGRYAIEDSDPSTWSNNQSTDGWGIAEVRGFVKNMTGNPFGTTID